MIEFLIREEFWIRLIGGIFLVGIGIGLLFQAAAVLVSRQRESRVIPPGLTSSRRFCSRSPTPRRCSLFAVLATLGLEKHRPVWQTSFLVLGIFCGSMTWWIILAAGVNLMRRKITDRTMRWMNRAAGIAIGGFGLVNVLLSRGHRH